MSAKPVIPGLLYLVTHQGQRRYISAAHPCDAICIALAALVAP